MIDRLDHKQNNFEFDLKTINEVKNDQNDSWKIHEFAERLSSDRSS